MAATDATSRVPKPSLGVVAAAALIVVATSAFFAIIFHETPDTAARDDAAARRAAKLTPKAPTSRPDFAAIDDVDKLKKAFFEYLTAFVDAENQRIIEKREVVLSIQRKLHTGVDSAADRAKLDELAAEYGISSSEPLDAAQRLLRRIDVLPVDMVLVQGAIESGWGRSRFAVDANNLFGMRCFSAGCGLVPSQRAPDAVYEVRRFSSPEASVAAYMHTLNTYPSYAELRRRRATIRQAGETASGLDLAETLVAYSTRGEDYVDQVKTILRQYNRRPDAGRSGSSAAAAESPGTET